MEQKITLGADYRENVAKIDGILHPDRNFDLIKKILTVGEDELTLYFIDGFVKDAVMQKLMLSLVSLKGLGGAIDGERARHDKKLPTCRAVEAFIKAHVPYVEADTSSDVDQMLGMVLSGATLMLGSAFGEYAVIVDARTYPARESAWHRRVCRSH